MSDINRRRAIGLGVIATGSLAMPAILRAQEAPQRNASGYTMHHWRDHFETLGKGAIVSDTASRALYFWSADETVFRTYPTSVPISEELTRRGYTEVVRKTKGPTWTPTPSQMERYPDWRPVAGGDPANPLGSHALYLSWPAYLIHGTHDTRKIGRLSSDGCIGLYNEKIAELFALCPVGAQVRII